MYLLFTLVLLIILQSSAVKYRTPNDIPNPKVYPVECGREGVLHSSICDPDSLLDKTGKDEIEGYINSVVVAQLAVAIIDKMEKSILYDAEEQSKQYAHKIHDRWGVGESKLNNGILIFLSIQDRRVYISTGKGVEAVLTQRRIEYIIQSEMAPHLKKNEYSKAISKAIIAIKLLLDGGSLEVDENDGQSFYIFFSVVISVACACLCFSYAESEKISKIKKGREAMEKLMKAVDVKNAKHNRYFVTTCPICLEEFSESNSHEKDHESLEFTESDRFVPQKKKVATKLPCGHLFCVGCIHEYLESARQQKCPVCRADIANVTNNTESHATLTNRSYWSRFRQGNSFGYQPISLEMAETQQENEILFRCHRLHQIHPSVMTNDLLQSVRRAIKSNGENTASVYRVLQGRSVEVDHIIEEYYQSSRLSAESNGSYGADSTSFDGGESSGGGGGSW